jgi:hypothetical protein
MLGSERLSYFWILGLKLSGYATDRRRGTNVGRAVIAMSSPLSPDLSRIVVLRHSHNLGSRMSHRVTDHTLGVAMFGFVLGTPLVLDVVAFALLALHDPVDAAWRTVLAVIVEATLEVPLLAIVVTLVDVAVGVATTPVLVKVGA